MKQDNLKKIIRKVTGGVLVGTSMAAMLSAPSSFAASGSVQVDITFPRLVILYYYDNIDIAVDAGDFSDMVADGVGSCTASSTAGVAELDCSPATDPLALTSANITNTEASYDAGIGADGNVSSFSGNTDLTFVIENSWAVRALGGSLAATIGVGSGDFTNPQITPAAPTSSMTLSDGNNIGDIQFDVDVASLTGLIASDAFTITVTSNP